MRLVRVKVLYPHLKKPRTFIRRVRRDDTVVVRGVRTKINVERLVLGGFLPTVFLQACGHTDSILCTQELKCDVGEGLGKWVME